MPNEYGFRFKINGEIFVAQKSKAGADVVAAYTEAVEIREDILHELLGIPATFTMGAPVAASRRVPVFADVEDGPTAEREPIDPANGIDPPAEDGPTPELELPSRKGRKAKA